MQQRILSYLSVLVLVFCLSCGKPQSESRQVADRFVRHYYVDTDLSKASGDTDGVAAQKVGNSLKLTEGQVQDKSTHRPSVSVSLIESTSEAPSSPGEGPEATYLYLVEIKPEKMDVIRKKTLVKTRKREGGWKVTQFADYEMDGASPL